jgi:flagellar hook-length control protein FliK
VLLERNLADLRVSLQQAGVNLGGVSVGQNNEHGHQDWKGNEAHSFSRADLIPETDQDIVEPIGINRVSTTVNNFMHVDYLA